MHRVRTSVLVLGILILACAASAQDWAVVAGNWSGKWSNSLGESGNDSLALNEDANGNVSGIWTNEVPVSGRRVNSNTIELRGQTAARSYQITATVKGDELSMQYMATRLNGTGSYSGEARLFRQ